MDQPLPHEDLIGEFCGLTGASPLEAEQFLEANRWDLSSAATEFFTAQEETIQEPVEEPPVPENYTGPRTLDGRPAPTSAIPTVGSSSRTTRQPPRGGVATLGSLSQGEDSHAGHGHDHDDDDDDDDEDYQDEGEPRDLFAGGEKSGLAVQDPRRNEPRNLVNDIIKKARAQSKKSAEESSAAPSSRFRGTGMTLGGDDAPSQAIPDPTAPPTRPSRGDVQTRVLHLWQDGFSIDDGHLYRFDDPENAATLQLIRSGRAPINLMNVQPNQPVEVSLNKHDEPYKPQPKVYKAFSGGGQRLGSPTPGGTSTTTTALAAPVSAAVTSSSTPEVDLDTSQPTIALRIQLANGTRLPSRFNITHTIGDVYSFIARASPDSNSRPWVLATTFPNKNHTDKNAILGDVPEFKKGGTAVQKWA